MIQKILCFLGLHIVKETHGIYRLGKCEICGVEDMFF
jgi:hypothetical protein